MEENLTLDNENRPSIRPTFLTVLCILTFIGSGFGIINGVSTMFMGTVTSEITNGIDFKEEFNRELDRQLEQGENSELEDKFARELGGKMVGSVGNVFANMKWLGLTTLIVSILCIVGAILMWNLKKNGFFLYTGAQVIGIVMPFILLGGNIFAAMMSFILSIFAIAFIIMYAVNLKYMK
ncbi:MAG: hypothetical protein ACK4K0_01310 [Flavobacteriales bacterium]